MSLSHPTAYFSSSSFRPFQLSWIWFNFFCHFCQCYQPCLSIYLALNCQHLRELLMTLIGKNRGCFPASEDNWNYLHYLCSSFLWQIFDYCLLLLLLVMLWRVYLSVCPPTAGRYCIVYVKIQQDLLFVCWISVSVWFERVVYSLIRCIRMTTMMICIICNENHCKNVLPLTVV